MTNTCAPPEEHRGRLYHWVFDPFVEEPIPLRWDSERRRYFFEDGDGTGDQMYRAGWRYVAPCVPPPAREGEGP